MDGGLNVWKHGRRDGGMVEWIGRWMDYHVDGLLDRCVHAWSDGRMVECIDG